MTTDDQLDATDTVRASRKLLMRHLDPATPWALRTVASTGLLDLAASGKTVSEMAEIRHYPPHAVEALFNYLAELDYVTSSPTGHVTLTTSGQVLQDFHQSDFGAHWLDPEGFASQSDAAFRALHFSIATGASGYSLVHGQTVYDHMAKDSRISETFRSGMEEETRHMAAVIGPVTQSDRSCHVVDVGGGTGAFLATVLETDDLATGILFELPAAKEAAVNGPLQPHLASGRAQFEGGNFNEDDLPDGDILILSHVLLDWNYAAAMELLIKCRRALRQDGRLYVIEPTRDPVDGTNFGNFPLRALVTTGGQIRTSEEIGHLCKAAGFIVQEHRLLPGGQQRHVTVAAIDTNI